MEPEDNSSDAEKAIEIRSLRIAFNGVDVLKDVSFFLNKGENLIVLGKSGSGKSVLIKCIVNLLIPDEGSVLVLGKDMRTHSKKEQMELRRQIGFLFQSGALYDSMTVQENLEFPLRRYKKKITEEELNERVEEALKNVGLSDINHKMPSELSGGMRKRVALARTIIVNPLILLYDEPTTGLDPITSAEISDLVNQIREKYKTSSIIITHDIACAKKTGDRILLLKDGEIKAEGTFREMEESDDEWIKSFFK